MPSKQKRTSSQSSAFKAEVDSTNNSMEVDTLSVSPHSEASKFQHAVALFDPPMTSSLKPRKLPQLYEAWLKSTDLGAYISEDEFFSRLRNTPFVNTILPLFEQALLGNVEGLKSNAQLLISMESSSSGENIKALTNEQTQRRDVNTNEQTEAVLKSWKSNYYGAQLLLGFEKHIEKYWARGQMYARCISLIQSSMVGKSRMMNEFAKKPFCIPINLRLENSTGFPAGDHRAMNFVCGMENRPLLPFCFLAGLFRGARKWIDKDRENFHPRMFQSFMSNGQEIKRQGSDRINFYDGVLEHAEKVKRKSLGRGTKKGQIAYASTRAFRQLLRLSASLDETFIPLWKKWKGGDKLVEIPLPDMPLVYLVVDEAHSLSMFPPNPSLEQDNFIHFRRALRDLISLPLVTVFLSTTGSVSSLATSRRLDSSERISKTMLTVIPPWTTFGWDHLAHDRKMSGKETIDSLAELRQISKLGRPSWGLYYEMGTFTVKENLVSFAAEKLTKHTSWSTCRPDAAMYFACLSQRMVIEPNTTTYRQLKFVQEAVESHLRICMALPEDRELLITSAPSEPILSEAACQIMETNPHFKIVDGLQILLRGYGLSQGDRGELVAMALLTKARDLTVQSLNLRVRNRTRLPMFSIPAFFRNLFTKDLTLEMPSMCRTSTENKTFGDQFSNSTLFFNHFIQPDQWDVALDRDMHPLFLGRCSAIRGATNQPGFDFLGVALLSGNSIEKANRTLILMQIKNNEHYNEVPDKALFHAMCPEKLGMIKPGEEHPPIIRIVFALASKKSSFTKVEYSAKESREHCKVTTYDFYCSGMDPAVLVPVIDELEAWQSVLRDEPWAVKYNHVVPDVQDDQRSQAPLARKHEGHTRALDALEVPFSKRQK